MYYYVNIQKLSDSTTPMSVTGHATFDSADAALHYDIWYAEQGQNASLNECKAVIIDEHLNPIKSQIWKKTVEVENSQPQQS